MNSSIVNPSYEKLYLDKFSKEIKNYTITDPELNKIFRPLTTECMECQSSEVELKNAHKQIALLQKQLKTNKTFSYMIVHDLKHPTEATISTLNVIERQLITYR